MRESLAVFVNTSDGFTDCWGPFFSLFERFANGLRKRPIYLNTERVDYSWPALTVKATRVWPVSEMDRPSWSECLSRGLRVIEEPYVLYLQEDYFLKRATSDELIADSLSILERDPTVGVVYLNEHGPEIKRSSPYGSRFVEIHPPARYLVSTQAAIWRKEFLTSLARSWENGWMFEKFGSLRVKRYDIRLLSVRPSVMTDAPVIDYVYTGVMKGCWNIECISLFERHGIQVDFQKRGFYRAGGRWKSRLEVLRKLLARPSSTVKSLSNLVGG